jgi:sec-independent protein translocase protein TatA
MGALSAWHWVIILVVVVVLFGSKKLPDAARGLGRSLRIFKSEVKEMQNDGKDTTSGTANPAQTVTSEPAQLPAPEPYTPGSTQQNPESKSA